MRRRRFISGLLGAGAGVGLTSSSGGTAGAAPVRAAGGPHDWQTVPAPACATAAQLLAVAAAGPDLAWAVGEEGRNGSTRGKPLALVWDGSIWTRLDLTHLGFSGGHLRAVAGSYGAAWAVGVDSGGAARLLRWDGTTWQEAEFAGRSAYGTALTGVALDADDHVWLSGRNSDGCVLLHGDADGWLWLPPPPNGPPTAPAGLRVTRGGDVWVYDSALVARWDHEEWTGLPAPAGLRPYVTGLLPVADDDIWLTGYDYGVGGPPGKPPSAMLKHWDGGAWASVATPFTPGMLTAIVDDGLGGPDRIAGWDFWDQTRSHHLRWEAGAWVSERGPLSATPVLVNALATVPGAGGYWAVGTDSASPYPPAQVHIER
ncbi:hypothetical protein DI272_34045 [Streptomyces sp. Act143]|uniref:hypothetical protein n=1 Tax=Streptomyces sp. Act143 TaxID=2200760 RepID=UPI000D67A6A7|nr:hypothetical protein [Streptomyces sp. Act143]PWI18600.1 hypothetical protein DI272_34045 [Streptomyces sp. Act143]